VNLASCSCCSVRGHRDGVLYASTSESYKHVGPFTSHRLRSLCILLPSTSEGAIIAAQRGCAPMGEWASTSPRPSGNIALRRVPVLTPPVWLDFLLFGSVSAPTRPPRRYCGTFALTPIQIGSILQGNVISARERRLRARLGNDRHLAHLVVAYALLQRRTSKWLRA